MGETKSLRIFLLSLTVLLVACGDSGSKIGSTIKGERIAVIEQAKTLEADKDLAIKKPTLPPSIINLSWSQAGYDSEHNIPYADVSPHPKVIWKKSIGEGSDSDFKLLAQPVVGRGIIYTIDAQGLVRAFDAKTGEDKWKFDTTPKDSDDKAIAGGLAVDGVTVYATTGFGEVYALNAKTGSLKWRKELLKPLRAAPAVADNHIYVVSIDNELNALNAANGEILWHHAGISESATLMGASSPAVEGDSVVVAYNSGELFSLRAQNGRPSWNYSLAGPTQVGALPAIADIRGLPVIDHGRVYAISHSGRIAAIDQRSGDRLWENDTGGINTPLALGDTIFIYGGESQLIALDSESGRVVWVKSLPKLADPKDNDSDHIIWAGPIPTRDRLWMVNSLGKLASFSPLDGESVDSIDLGNAIYLPPITADHMLYVVTDDGTLIALR